MCSSDLALNYSTGLPGSSNHLAAELFKALAGVDIARVNYKGAGPALTALIGGETQLMFATAGSVAPQLKSGRIRALAVTGLQRSALAPELPTVAEAGLKGYESSQWYGLFAPAGTPADILNLLNSHVARFMQGADIKQRLGDEGVVPVGGTREQLAAHVKSEIAKWANVIKLSGARVD